MNKNYVTTSQIPHGWVPSNCLWNVAELIRAFCTKTVAIEFGSKSNGEGLTVAFDAAEIAYYEQIKHEIGLPICQLCKKSCKDTILAVNFGHNFWCLDCFNQKNSEPLVWRKLDFRGFLGTKR